MICNENVTKKYIWRDDIHLNKEGTCIFAGNFVDYLNTFILSRNV